VHTFACLVSLFRRILEPEAEGEKKQERTSVIFTLHFILLLC
jgi:hypothetical protein